jgi:hypothetical protein
MEMLADIIAKCMNKNPSEVQLVKLLESISHSKYKDISLKANDNINYYNKLLKCMTQVTDYLAKYLKN